MTPFGAFAVCSVAVLLGCLETTAWRGAVTAVKGTRFANLYAPWLQTRRALKSRVKENIEDSFPKYLGTKQRELP